MPTKKPRASAAREINRLGRSWGTVANLPPLGQSVVKTSGNRPLGLRFGFAGSLPQCTPTATSQLLSNVDFAFMPHDVCE